MHVDVVQEINATERRVGSRTLAAGEARVVTLRRIYRAPVEDVWDAVTTRERIPRWFLPISGELRVGGRYQLEGQAGGTIERCDPPRSLFATWEFGGEVSWIEVSLSPADSGGTRLELQHIAHVDDERWAQYGPGAVGVGWDLGLLGLGQHLSTGEAVDTAAAMAWVGSEEGRRYVAACSESWGEASVAAGTQAEAARAAAGRTTAFYTGT